MGIATVAILIGDLNLDPVQIRGVISDHRQAPMGEDDEPRPKRRRVSSYVVLGPSREATIGTDTVQILATSRPTHRRGGRLDCAIVAYFGVPDARPVWAGVDVPVAPMPVGESVPIRDRQGNQTGRSDHYPIRLLLRT